MNKIVLTGNLTSDPELRYTQTGKAVASIYIINENRQTKETLGMPIVLWNKTAEIAAEHLKKGSKILVEGYLKKRKVENQQYPKGYYEVTEVTANSIEFM